MGTSLCSLAHKFGQLTLGSCAVPHVREPVEELRQLLQESFYCYTESLELAKQVKASGVTIAICSNHSAEVHTSAPLHPCLSK
jgi:hypothetical protein